MTGILTSPGLPMISEEAFPPASTADIAEQDLEPLQINERDDYKHHNEIAGRLFHSFSIKKNTSDGS